MRTPETFAAKVSAACLALELAAVSLSVTTPLLVFTLTASGGIRRCVYHDVGTQQR